MSDHDETLLKLAELERALKQHTDFEVKNLNRLRRVLHPHTGAVCKAILALLQVFADRKVVVLVEAESSDLDWKAGPEDIVAWIEGKCLRSSLSSSSQENGVRSFFFHPPALKVGAGPGFREEVVSTRART